MLTAKLQLQFTWVHESLALAKPFKISRGVKTHAEVVVLKLSLGDITGWAEAVPYGRYNETIDSTCEALHTIKLALHKLQNNTPIGFVEQAHAYINEYVEPSSAKNLVDCALWDLKAKLSGKSVNELLGLNEVEQCISAQTLSVDSIEKMLFHAKQMAHLPLIKIKLDSVDVLTKIQAIHKACPDSQFIIDANEAWNFNLLKEIAPQLAKLNVALIEQPLPADNDNELIDYSSPVPLCADESCHTSADINVLRTKYNMVNIKLDKTGGLSEALALAKAATTSNMQIMLGCMVASSLAMAPIFMLAQYANFVDLDGPVLVAQDRPNGFTFNGAQMSKPSGLLWGES